MRKKAYIIIISTVAGALSLFLFLQSVPMCPEDYPNTDNGFDKQMSDLEGWTGDFYDDHPNASLSEWAEARLQFYRENNCIITLKRYNDMKEGKGDPAQMKIIRNALQEAANNSGGK